MMSLAVFKSGHLIPHLAALAVGAALAVPAAHAQETTGASPSAQAVPRAGASGINASEAPARPLIETPTLAPLVKAGKLPAIADRLPKQPRVMELSEPGRHGGTLRTLFGRTKDIRLMTVYGYARLVGFDSKLELAADILESYQVIEGRQFTFKLRPGHRWSDGAPFTAEDFRYYWEDVATNETISPLGPGAVFKVNGKLPRFEIIDPHTERYTSDAPNPQFLSALAAPRPPFLYRPAHYLKQFHARYTDEKTLQARVEEKRQRNWRALHFKMDRPYRNDNIAYPTLQPWKNTTKPPSQRFLFQRNPFFHRIDETGRQLPYIDEVAAGIASAKLIPLKVGTGDAEFQARGLEFKDYTFAKRSAKRNNYDVRLWRSGKGAEIALYPNLNANDPNLGPLLRDVRFRRALSIAIDREEINQVIYFGLATPSGNSLLPSSPLYKRARAFLWARHDPGRANRLLDAMGLTERRGDGIRLYANGEPIFVIVETPGESASQTDSLQLIQDHWRRVGIGMIIKPSRREVMRNRAKTGTTAFTVFSGLDNGLATANFAPDELVPTNEDQLQWPLWGRHFASGGEGGIAPDMGPARTLVKLHRAWQAAREDAERRRIWEQILQINASQVYVMGLVSEVPQPVVVSNALMGVPQEAYYNWNPGALIGVHNPDTFWFAAKGPDSASLQ